MPTTLADVLQATVDLVDLFDGREDEMRDWWGGTVTGGFNADGTASDGIAPHGGYYPMTNSVGTTIYFPSISKLGSVMLKGDPGVDAGLRYVFTNATADADPTSGHVGFNNATPASVTTLFFSDQDKLGGDMTAWIGSLDDSTNPTAKSRLVINQGAGTFAIYDVTGAVVTAAGYHKVPVTYVGGAGAYTPGADVIIASSLFGPQGPQGIQGPQGTPGTNGTNGTNGATGPAAWSTPGPWVTGTNYVVGPPASVVTISGSTYVCLSPHTSGTFATDLGAGKWLLVAQKGADGAGSGNVNTSGATTAGQVAVYADATGNLLQGHTLVKADVGLGNVDNTSDANKPISTAQQAALNSLSSELDTHQTEIDAKLDASAFVKATNADVDTGTDDAKYMTAAKTQRAITNRQVKTAIPIPASGMTARTTNGATGPNTAELATNRVMVASFDFNTATQQYAQFRLHGVGASVDLTSFTFKAIWSHAATSTNFGVTWSLQALALSDGDDQDVAFGAAVQVSDTGGVTNKEYQTAESTPLTISNSPAVGDTLVFQVSRVVADANDTLGIDARLEGIVLYAKTKSVDD